MNFHLPRCCLVAALVFAGAAHAADVGRVLLAAGNAVAIRGNQAVKLTFSTPIQDKDVLRTGPASNLQVRFTDESIVSLKENSELRIDEFQFSGKEDGNERAFLRLLKGGLRTVTGLIGRLNHKNYQMSTATATIGIRGTDYAATLCQGDCRHNDGSLAKDGLYGRVHGLSHGTNRIDVANERDQKAFGINENFYVADAKSLVESLLVAPDFVSNRLEGRKQGGNKGESGGSGTEQATAGGAAAESRPSTTPDPLPQPQFVTTEDLDPGGSPTVIAAAVVAPQFSTQPEFAPGFAPGSIPGLGVLSATAVPHAPGSPSSHTVECDGAQCGLNTTVTFDSIGYKRVDLGGGFIDRNAATVAEIGSVAGVIEWGRWSGGPTLAGGFFNNLTFGPNQGFHYVVGVLANPMPTSGAVTFNLLGATSPTFSDGVGGGLGTGNMTSGSASVNFLAGSITAQMSLAFSSASGTSNYALAMTNGGFTPGTTGLSGNGTLSFSSGVVNVCPSGCNASFGGFFAGQNASHLGLGYDATATMPNVFFINGVAVLSR